MKERKEDTHRERERRDPLYMRRAENKSNRVLPDKKNRRDKYLKHVTQTFNELERQVNRYR